MAAMLLSGSGGGNHSRESLTSGETFVRQASRLVAAEAGNCLRPVVVRLEDSEECRDQRETASL
jgi:hypothetical protein